MEIDSVLGSFYCDVALRGYFSRINLLVREQYHESDMRDLFNIFGLDEHILNITSKLINFLYEKYSTWEHKPNIVGMHIRKGNIFWLATCTCIYSYMLVNCNHKTR